MPLLKIRAYLYLLLLGIGAACWWLYSSELGIVSEAPGVVVPTSKVARVQHLEGGIVKSIEIREGQKVQKGEPIIVLESISSGADVEEIVGRIAGYKIDKVRLEAELKSETVLRYPVELRTKHKALVTKAVARFKGRRVKQKGLIAAQAELVKQRRAESEQIVARVTKNKKNLELLDQQVAISKSLLEDKLTNKMTHIALLREQALVKGQLREDEAALTRLKHAITEAELRIESIKNSFQEEVGKELDEKTQALNALLERRQQKQDSLRRTVIRAPIAGTIQRLYYPTQGGVVAPSAVVADVVPDDDVLRVEASLPSQDVGYVLIGQTVQVRLASNDAFRFGKIDGKVVSISPDTVKTEGQPPHYTVIVSLQDSSFERSGNSYQLVPGVRVLCGIVIGSRSVIEYVFEPFLTEWSNSLSER